MYSDVMSKQAIACTWKAVDVMHMALPALVQFTACAIVSLAHAESQCGHLHMNLTTATDTPKDLLQKRRIPGKTSRDLCLPHCQAL